MCGRYVDHVAAMHGWTDILKDWPSEVKPGYNVAPSQLIAAFTAQGGQAMRWGLIPPWLEQASGFSTFNARLETAADKPSFKHAWFNSQRCLVPALGYYEWRQQEGAKQPYLVKRRDNNVLVFGALFEPSQPHVKPYSCTFLTRPASGVLLELHRVTPVFIQPQQALQWLSGSPAQAMEIATTHYADEYEYYPVSDKVNKVANQGRELIRKISLSSKPQQGFDF
jgi:putative SOS response-associated peptidase YedK